VVFRSKPYFKNWLTVEEWQTAPRVPCEDGGYITEADVEREVQSQLLQEFASLGSLPLDPALQASAPSQSGPGLSQNQAVLGTDLDIRDKEAQGLEKSNEDEEGQLANF
jgi:hypothetical protein